jgi:hypothetical protein
MLEKENNLSPDDMFLFKVVDTADDAVQHIVEFYEKFILKPNF